MTIDGKHMVIPKNGEVDVLNKLLHLGFDLESSVKLLNKAEIEDLYFGKYVAMWLLLKTWLTKSEVTRAFFSKK